MTIAESPWQSRFRYNCSAEPPYLLDILLLPVGTNFTAIAKPVRSLAQIPPQ